MEPVETMTANPPGQTPDVDPQETGVAGILAGSDRTRGRERAHYLLERLIDSARHPSAYLPYSAITAYVANTIPAHREERTPGDAAVEARLRSLRALNALAMVVKANRKVKRNWRTLPATLHRRRCTRWVSITSFGHRAAIRPVIWFLSKDTVHRAFTRVLTSTAF
ncbi:MAG: hypothetical protein U1F34_08300 [Gammaproteobacteria bacterium]